MVLFPPSDRFALCDEYLWYIYCLFSVDVIYFDLKVSDLIFQHIILLSILMAILIDVGVSWLLLLLLLCVGGSMHFCIQLCSGKRNELPGYY